MQRVGPAKIKLYLIPSTKLSFNYFKEEVHGINKPFCEDTSADFHKNEKYTVRLKFLSNPDKPVDLKLNDSGKLESEHPIYHPKLKKFSSGYCLSFIVKDGDHQWLAIITANKAIPKSFVYYEDDFGEDDI